MKIIAEKNQKLKVAASIAACAVLSAVVIGTATPAKAEEATPLVEASEGYYPLKQWERSLVERTVYSEAGNQTFVGQMAVAQCILDACEKENSNPLYCLSKYGYANARPYCEVTESVKDAVTAVFENGYRVTDENILWFYNPSMCASEWHESQQFVIELGDHRFFAEVQ